MGRAPQKMIGLTVSITDKAKLTLDRQAAERGYGTSLWAGRVFDLGFAAVCAREKSMPISDGDLDAIVGASLMMWHCDGWDTATIAKGLGVAEPVVVRILDGWKEYRRAGA